MITEGSYRAGWGINTYAAANFMMINVPGVVPSQTFQLIYNTLTKAWTIFEGMLANCWAGDLRHAGSTAPTARSIVHGKARWTT